MYNNIMLYDNMKTTEAQRRASRKYYYKKKTERENLINENKKLNSDDTDSDRVSIGDNENINLNNIHQDKNNVVGIDINEQQDIYQFDEFNGDKTYIVNTDNSNCVDNGDEQSITISVDDNQLKSVLSIFVLLYVYFRIYNFSDSNTIVQQLEQKDEYIRIIDRITNKLKLIIEKYSYLQKIYNNIEDFFFIIDIVLLASVVEGEITTTTKKDKTVKEVIESEPEPESEQQIDLFSRL